jgi:PAS domain-containing protein
MEGLAAIAANGRIAWANGAAAKLLGVASFGCELGAEEVFALRLTALSALTREADAKQHRLPSGLMVWLRAHMQAPDGAGRIVKIGAADHRRDARLSRPSSS